jgi:hypothetical protein
MSLVLCYKTLRHFNIIHDLSWVRIIGNNVANRFDGIKAHVLDAGNIVVAYTGVSEIGDCACKYLERSLIRKRFDDRNLLLDDFSGYVKGINNGFRTTSAAREIEQAGFSTETGFAIVGNLGKEELFHLVRPSGKTEESGSYVILGSFSSEFRSFIRDQVSSQRSAEVLAANIEARYPQYRELLTNQRIERKGESICLT